MKLTIGHIDPDLLNLYGDQGNIRCLEMRLKWRGLEAEVIPILAGELIDFKKMDILLLGGGSDREQKIACRYLLEYKEDFRAYAGDNGVLLAVCGGYQLLGTHYRTKDDYIRGLGLLDIYTEWAPRRLVKNIILESPLSPCPVVGFENHGGRTYIGNHRPFGKVLFGSGNTGKSGYEGIIYKNVLGTYLHGPLLPRNPHICDHLLKQALKRRYGQDIALSPLWDQMEQLASLDMLSRFGGGRKYAFS